MNPYLESSSSMNPEQDKMFLFTDAKKHLQNIIDDWKEEIEKTKQRRKARKVEVDVKELRKTGVLEPDETLVPVRVIDTNITRELPPYVNYTINSRRLVTFACVDDPSVDTGKLEEDFTKGMRYKAWEIPHFKCTDGAVAHGSDAVEVIYDSTKPLGVSLEHVGHDKLFFPRSLTDLQQAPRVIRQFDVTILKLREWVSRFGFSSQEVGYIADRIKDTAKENETMAIYRVYFKKDGAVWVAWFSLEGCCKDWLKAPEKLSMGAKIKQQMPMMQPGMMQGGMMNPGAQGMMPPQEQWIDAEVKLYPIFLLYYRITEESKITDNIGRIDLDSPKQEAQTAIQSSFINGMTRASSPFASLAEEDGSGGPLKELELKLIPGRILNKKINYFAPDYPDAVMLRYLQYADTSNSQETGQVNFAAMNREDSRKTATEMQMAQQTQSTLSSVALVLYSTYQRSVYDFVWLIVQALALQGPENGGIKFYQKAVQRPVIGVDGQPVIGPDGQPAMDPNVTWVNDVEFLSKKFEVTAAGDVDVIQRERKINAMMQDWPVISQTPLKDIFLQDLMKLKYPDVGERYASVLREQTGMMQQMQSTVMRLVTILEGTLSPEEISALPPQQQADLAQLMTSAKQMGGQVAS